MRSGAVAVLAAAALAAPAGDWAAATWSSGTLRLALHYEMTCGLPGAGPVEVHLPAALGIVPRLRATVDGKPAPVSRSGRSLEIALPKPPEVTCMSIAPGVLHVTLRQLVARTPGTVTIRARIRDHTFKPRVRLP